MNSGFCERACFLRDLHGFSLDRKMGNKGLSVICFSSLGVEIELQRALRIGKMSGARTREKLSG